jgi:ABC-type transport system involved in cytochrome c biogenesis ATPase subunit
MALIRLTEVTCQPSGLRLFGSGLSVEVHPGLSFVRGGEGRGKTSLLRLLAGRLEPSSGRIERSPGLTVVWNDPADPQDEQMDSRAWLAAQRTCFPDWDDAGLEQAIHALGLGDHLSKRLYMLSTGTRRKLGLAVARASNAQLVLLEHPWAALDARSREAVTGWLEDRIPLQDAGRSQAWVVADYDPPPGLHRGFSTGQVRLIDLGD